MAAAPTFMELVELGNARRLGLSETDPEIAARIPDPAVTQALQRPGLSYRGIIATVMAGYADRPALGSRAHAVDIDGAGRASRRLLPAFDTVTYRELGRRIEAIASFWSHHPDHRVSAGDRVAFIAFTGAEMATVDLACNLVLAVSVPLQANLPPADMRAILADTQPVTVATTVADLAAATAQALDADGIRSLIVLDADPRFDADRAALDEARARIAAAGRAIGLMSFAEVVDYGAARSFDPPAEPDAGPDHVSMIMYTSGSTGTPKGAIIHDAISTQFWAETIPVYRPTVMVAYAPMNHFMGRNMVHATLAQGGTAYFTPRSDLSTLFEDFRLVRPTDLLFIPRVCELVYQHYQAEVQRRVAGGEAEDVADAGVRGGMRTGYLGDRLCATAVGSSPTAPEVRRFIAECWQVPLVEGYGCTEAGASAMTAQNRLVPGMITDFRLADVPELGYFATDRPYPRGELLVRTSRMFKGYFKRPEATAEVFTDDGFLRTGDIVEQRGPDELVWVDRRGNVIKLSQAEFVAVGPLEATYLGGSGAIDQIFVYGSSYRSCLLAVVVPDMAFARARLGDAPDGAALRRLILDELAVVARGASLKTFEIPRDILIEHEPFSLENGLLSSARKPLRPNIRRRYVDRLEAMYEAMDRRQQAELARLRGDGGGSVAERIAAAFRASLGLPELDATDARSYGDLGGDSLGAVGLSALLEEMFGVEIPVSTILHPAAGAGWLAGQVERARTGGEGGVGFAQVHRREGVLNAGDLTLDRFLDEAALAAAARAAPPVETIRTVLLTGANGFLGRFLLLDWMERVGEGGRAICLGRGGDRDAAYARIEAAFDKGDPALLARFRALAADRLEIVPGDLAEPGLGLSADSFARLAAKVDHIVHPAALVNHRLSYRSLFEPNVVGTAELIRLALTGRIKRFDYVSTVAVLHLLPGLATAPEASDVRDAGGDLAIVDDYAFGYAASKWAGEVLLRDAHARFGLPVNVFRPNMILPHRRYAGQYNETDMMTRLLYSVVQAGVAPASFYAADGRAPRARAHYDGLPVDFLAAVMGEVGSRPATGFRSYNMINDRDDGVSLDSFVDWVETAGHSVARIADHAAWVERFASRLRNLPDAARQQSSLAILDHFARPHPTEASGMASADFAAVVRTTRAGPDLPELDEAYIHKYLGDMHLRGLIPAGAPAVERVAEPA